MEGYWLTSIIYTRAGSLRRVLSSVQRKSDHLRRVDTRLKSAGSGCEGEGEEFHLQEQAYHTIYTDGHAIQQYPTFQHQIVTVVRAPCKSQVERIQSRNPA